MYMMQQQFFTGKKKITQAILALFHWILSKFRDALYLCKVFVLPLLLNLLRHQNGIQLNAVGDTRTACQNKSGITLLNFTVSKVICIFPDLYINCGKEKVIVPNSSFKGKYVVTSFGGIFFPCCPTKRFVEIFILFLGKGLLFFRLLFVLSFLSFLSTLLI